MPLIPFIQSRLQAAANPIDAPIMQAYMKTDMPFYGVKKPGRTQIFREAKAQFKPTEPATWRAQVQDLWAQPEREWKYLALSWARLNKRWITAVHLDLFEHLVREGAWWDLVDETAAHLVGKALATDRETLTPVMRQWLKDDDVWIRRTAILSQLTHKADTDRELLFDACRDLAPETSFWIRKAIGWSLREYGKTNPDAVRAFVAENEGVLSGLSSREALKRLQT